jgi:hypothetical protein
MSAAERGAYLESPPGDAPDIEEAHQVGGVDTHQVWLLVDKLSYICG